MVKDCRVALKIHVFISIFNIDLHIRSRDQVFLYIRNSRT